MYYQMQWAVWALWVFGRGNVLARTWTDVMQSEDFIVEDSAKLLYLLNIEEKLFHDTVAGTFGDRVKLPEVKDRSPTTNAPSPMPSTSPSDLPSSFPSISPSALPSAMPSISPTALPSHVPSPDPYPPGTAPANPEQGYFDYNDASGYGPKNWGTLTDPTPFYWDEFGKNGFGAWSGVLKKFDLSKNMCATGKRQSPIDVKENGATCYEFHEVRSKPGQFPLGGNDITKQILSNKLRLLYRRRPCADVINDPTCQEPDPPFADFPHGWPGTADVINIDFKIPSEHTISGERFDAEMQIFHIHPARDVVAVQTVVIRAQQDGFNYYLQQAIDVFQMQFDMNRAKCGQRLRQIRRFDTELRGFADGNRIRDDATLDRNSWVDFSTLLDDPERDQGRNLQVQGLPWDPYHVMLIPTLYFWRYDGSLAEPPCTEFASWWVADKPMIASFAQVEQMKRIQFLNVDSQCRKTSAQFEHSIVRPIQDTNGRDIYHCTAKNFVADPPIPP
jgi:carbonic anhydrase